MPPKVANSWHRTGQTLLADVMELYRLCGCLFVVAVVVNGIVQLCLHPGLKATVLSDDGGRFLKQYMLPSEKFGSISVVEEPDKEELVANISRVFSGRVARLKDTALHIREKHSGHNFMFFIVHPLTAEYHEDSTNPLVFLDEFWRERVLSLDIVRVSLSNRLHQALDATEHMALNIVVGRAEGSTIVRSRKRDVVRTLSVSQPTKRERKATPDGHLGGAIGSMSWYAAVAQMSPDLYCIRAGPGTWLLPDYHVAHREVKKTPIKVDKLEGSNNGAAYRCTCRAFKMMSVQEDRWSCCIHTKFMESHGEDLETVTPVPPVGVIPVRSRKHSQAQGLDNVITFWTNGSFVTHVGKGLKCSRASHKGMCSCVRNVKEYMEMCHGVPNGLNTLGTQGGGAADDDMLGVPISDEVVHEVTEMHADEDADGDGCRGEVDFPSGLSQGQLKYKYPPDQDTVEAMCRVYSSALENLCPRVHDGMRCQCNESYMNGSVSRVGKCTIHLPEPLFSRVAHLYVVDCPNQNHACRLVFDEQEAFNVGLFMHTSETLVALRHPLQVFEGGDQ